MALLKGKYWDLYQRDCLRQLSDLSKKEFPSAKQSIQMKINNLRQEKLKETDRFKIKAIDEVIETLELFKKRIR